MTSPRGRLPLYIAAVIATAILMGTNAGLGLAIVATSFGLCTGTGVVLAARARHPWTP